MLTFGIIISFLTFIAGTETSSTTLNWAMAEIIRNPRVLAKAQKEVRTVFDGKQNVDETEIHELIYLKAVIKETLRLHPPLPLSFPREITFALPVIALPLAQLLYQFDWKLPN